MGNELTLGDVLTVILTSKPDAITKSNDKVYMNVALSEILALSILYTSDMSANYQFYKMYTLPKS